MAGRVHDRRGSRLALLVLLTAPWLASSTAADTGADHTAPYTLRSLSIHCLGRYDCASELYEPRRPLTHPPPVVLIGPTLLGSHAPRASTPWHIIDAFTSQGLAVVRFEYPPVGSARHGAGPGQTLHPSKQLLTWHHMALQLGVHPELARRVNASKLVLWGAEWSAGIVAQLAAEGLGELAVLQSPMLTLGEQLTKRVAALPLADLARLAWLAVLDLAARAVPQLMPPVLVPVAQPLPGGVAAAASGSPLTSLISVPLQQARAYALLAGTADSGATAPPPSVRASLLPWLLLHRPLRALPHVTGTLSIVGTAGDPDMELGEYEATSKQGTFVSYEQSALCGRYEVLAVAAAADDGGTPRGVDAGGSGRSCASEFQRLALEQVGLAVLLLGDVPLERMAEVAFGGELPPPASTDGAAGIHERSTDSALEHLASRAGGAAAGDGEGAHAEL